ncbi:oxysterol-binding protein-related protein 6-like [Zootermopsis nevadensis]|uniref:Oxysterol-binding protein-related protein 6 n=1 Tax=Zootermopsis nevadensis TaxID=136037 RepID=A0A067REF5_ZOONE|nr:oxysterol-binding protein-related protein 6-like [Zootermopsis nevadensis]XP_021914146.1 oxysterol-binding protein-related protein 6-like [Zootermopsis nevadensis]XP_021914148.1 oxysterol-binding protein-related protein 6-like [Zootermopsis nevadensis]XP_021914149.1 oxysterol-binding protein-related protein 6-like [Zootermopsis nevadensis]XP_021914150.1 oxysterol-binding protein-related protein 6-like [Zootermopsis nevadensis]XP_021914151.1 oxysterol-binding protein-related protein 6-like [
MTTGLRHIATEPANLSNKYLSMDKKRSPLPRNKIKSVTGAASDSEGSLESNSLSADSNNDHLPKTPPKDNAAKKRGARRGSEWEILEGLKDGQRFDRKPDICTGYLHKKRKWPLKGWHKRYFVVDKGILVYAKGPGDIARGKIHGSVDIGLSVISTKAKRKRLDIDAEEFIYHLKAKTLESFLKWVEQLKQHRLYRQHLLTFGTKDLPVIRAQGSNAEGDSSNRSKVAMTPPEIVPNRDGSLPRNVKPCSPPPSILGSGAGAGSRLAAWVIDSAPPLETLNKELGQVSQNIVQLTRILEQIESIPTIDTELANEGFSPNVKKDRKKFGLRKKKSSKGSSVDLTGSSPNKTTEPESASPLSVSFPGTETCSFMGLSVSSIQQQSTTGGLSSSNTSLPTTTLAARPQSLPGPEHLLPLAMNAVTTINNTAALTLCNLDTKPSGTPDNQIREDFAILAKEINGSLKIVLYTLTTERDRLKTALESDSTFLLNLGASIPSSAATGNMVASLRNSLNQALQQNADLRLRLARIHDTADLSDISSVGPASEVLQKPLHASLSYSSSCISASEFFDAEEYQLHQDRQGGRDGSDTSSEACSLTSEEGSVSSENSEVGTEYTPAQSLAEGTGASNMKCMTGRRTKLSAPRPDTEGLSLWNLLCKNIGKDLSQVSMPVALNEPLNMLQRMCEELEYSELLDKAAEVDEPYERMVYIAAFAVSSYGSSYFRAGSKPFNPVLGETYECIREDKGFRFIAEQVSHHPPISVCYAESRNFIFSQDARIKTKFWGKSMEFQPTGSVNVQLPRYGDQYQWNKVTTCVHNLFGGQRWVDQYGELRITNGRINCKLTFVKASYWSAKRHEVFGVVTNEEGKVVRNLFGKWSEALYCGVAPSARCVWRPGTMPEEYEMYYGFTRFAMELNELDPDMAKYLPITDTRFRPDQRLLEEGNLSAAETLKLQLEQAQRDRRKRKELEGIQHEPRWFSKCITVDGEESWKYSHKYWESRKSPGFVNMQFEALW